MIKLLEVIIYLINSVNNCKKFCLMNLEVFFYVHNYLWIVSNNFLSQKLFLRSNSRK